MFRGLFSEIQLDEMFNVKFIRILGKKCVLNIYYRINPLKKKVFFIFFKIFISIIFFLNT